ncbi:MAG: C25 family cysteine peptidase, partial [Thermoplasmatales archaeon]|nr:C25 family cysteine peptidase [Thermoplasmatales archaeon]
TGDYTIEQSWTMQLGYGTGDAGSGERGEDPIDTLTDDAEIVLQKNINNKAIKIDNDIDYAADFLKNHEMNPQYIALVGGPVSLPMLYIKNPIWYENPQEEKGEEYLATDSYYSDLDITFDKSKNVKGEYICYGEPGEYNGSNYEYANPELYTPELAVGRIVASNVLDGSALVVRSLDYDETPEYHSILTSRMCGDASANCAEHQRVEAFLPNGILSTRLQWFPPSTLGFWAPKDTFSSHTAGDPALMTKANFIIYNGHGFPDGWYYYWAHAHDYDNTGDTIRTEDVRTLEMKPSIVFSASCLCSALDWPTIWAGATDERPGEPDTFFSLGLIHAGALAHIGSTEESWGAFFGGEFNGYGDFELATTYFDELLSNDLSIGMAHSTAKQKYYSDYNSVFDKTCFLENVLYGEPAVNP